MGRIVFKAEVFEEGDVYVGFSPDLGVSSFGDTVEEATASLREAVDLFLEECETMGTLESVLEEAGFQREGDSWVSREPIAQEKLSLSR